MIIKKREANINKKYFYPDEYLTPLMQILSESGLMPLASG